jgi:serine/threonine protein kinase
MACCFVFLDPSLSLSTTPPTSLGRWKGGREESNYKDNGNRSKSIMTLNINKNVSMLHYRYDDHIVITKVLRPAIHGALKQGYYLKENHSGIPLAIKVFNKRLLHRPNFIEDGLQEMHILNTILTSNPHPNVIRCETILEDDNSYAMILPFCDLGDLFTIMDRNREADLPPNPMKELKIMGSTLLSAVAHIHSLGICHRDIDLQNILVTSEESAPLGYKLILGDFGQAKFMGRDGAVHIDSGLIPGKVSYTAPEVRKTGWYDGRAADVYSLGVVLFIILTGGYPPYSTIGDSCYMYIKKGPEAVHRLLTKNWGVHMEDSEEVKVCLRIILAMLKEDPAARPTIAQLQSNAFFSITDDTAIAAVAVPEEMAIDTLVGNNDEGRVVVAPPSMSQEGGEIPSAVYAADGC